MSYKYERSAYLKIWNVLQEIEHRRIISGKDDNFSFSRQLLTNLTGSEEAGKDIFVNLLYHKERVINITNIAKTVLSNIDYKFDIILKNYAAYFSAIKIEYGNLAEEYQQSQGLDNPNLPVYAVGYSENTREIRLNNILIAKPDFNSENEIFFTFLYKNPNKRFSKEEIEQTQGKDFKFHKRLQQIVNDLGFKGNVRDLFFVGISEKGVMFRNPVTKETLKDLNIKWLKIDDFIKNDKK